MNSLGKIGVRRLILYIEKRCIQIVEATIGKTDPSLEETQKISQEIVVPFFEQLKSRGVLHKFQIICDESNNPPDSPKRIDIVVQPYQSIDEIHLTLRYYSPDQIDDSVTRYNRAMTGITKG